MKTNKNKNPVFKNNLYFLGLIWKISPSRVILNFLSVLIDYGMWTFGSVIFMQYLFGTGSETRDFYDVLWFIWFAVGLSVASNIFGGWFYKNYTPRSNAKLNYQLNKMLFEKVKSVDLSCFENPDFYNTYTKAATEASDRAGNVLDACAVVISSLISSAYSISAMLSITPWALICILLPVIGNLFFGKKLSKIRYNIDQESVPARRRMDYVNRIVYFRKYASELRMTNVFSVLRNIYNNAVEESVGVSKKYAFKRTVCDCCHCMLMYVLGMQGMWAVAAILALNGAISVGDLAVLLSAIVSVAWMLNYLENGISNTMTNSLFIDNLKKFFNYVPKIDESAGGLIPPKEVESLEFRNVSFRYPGQEGYALNNVSLVFKRGTRHALVGINGSGKSTLIKLLLRFYDPQEGQILLNGEDIREFDIKKYRKLVGAAFQDFALFAATVVENVLLREPNTENDYTVSVKALKDSDVYEKIATLKYQENTILTKEFDNEGAELSGGEKQKIAIARAFAKNSPIVILDEPSSALDPIAEYKMFETITKLCEGEEKLSVIVSHRLSSAAMCDRIFLFENGMLLEEGAHKELLDKKGKYADMFNKQARNYQIEGSDENE